MQKAAGCDREEMQEYIPLKIKWCCRYHVQFVNIFNGIVLCRLFVRLQAAKCTPHKGKCILCGKNITGYCFVHCGWQCTLTTNLQSTISVHLVAVRVISTSKGLSTREVGRGHATPHMPVETTKCWWLLRPSLSLKPAQPPSKMGQNL